MTVKIKLEVEPELIEKMVALDDEALEAVCDEEMEARVIYLEALVKGWRTYKNVKREHRRSLYMMLCSTNTEGLHKYERLVLYPKVLEMEKQEELQKLVEAVRASDVVSVTSTAELGADGSEHSAGEENPAPTDEIVPLDMYDAISSDEQTDPSTSPNNELIEDKTQMEAPNKDNEHIKNTKDLNDKQQEFNTRNVVSNDLDELERNLLEKKAVASESTTNVGQDLSVISNFLVNKYSKLNLGPLRNAIDCFETKSNISNSAEKNFHNMTFAQSIMEAIVKVREATDQVEKIQAEENSSIGVSTTDLMRLEEKLMQSIAFLTSSESSLKPIPEETEQEDEEMAMVEETIKKDGNADRHERNKTRDTVASEIEHQVNDNVNYEGMSVGQKKRAKKAARKEATKNAQEIMAKIKLEEEHRIKLQNAKLAADALSFLENKPSNSVTKEEESELETPAAQITKMLSENSNVQITEEDLKMYLQIKDKGKCLPDEATVLQKMCDNERDIRDTLMKAIEGQMARSVDLLSILQKEKMPNLVLPGNQNYPDNEKMWGIAKEFIIEKIAFWGESSHISAPYYVQMYNEFLGNLTINIAKLVFTIIPIEANPEINFEPTILLQYQAGKLGSLFEKLEENIQV